MSWFALLAVALPAGSAWAGGPTSVLLVSPQHNQTASLYLSEDEYEQLRSLTEAPQTAPAREADSASHATGPYITVTWLIHDVRVWRVDRIFVEAPGGPWIATQEVMDLDGSPNPRATANPGPGPALPQPAAWHPATEPQKLVDLLDGLGLLDPGATVPPRQPAAAPPSTTPAATAEGDGPNWWWAVPGMAAGTLLGASGMWYVARRTNKVGRSRYVPRQELLDM